MIKHRLPEDAVALLMAAVLGHDDYTKRDIEHACAVVRVMIKRYRRRIGKPLKPTHKLYSCKDVHVLLEALSKLPPEAHHPVGYGNV